MKRFTAICALISLVSLPIFAQDDSFFGDDFSLDEGGSSLILGGDLESSIDLNASKDGIDAIFDRDTYEDVVEESTTLGLNGSFSGTKSDFLMDLDFSLSGVAVKEAYAKYFGDYASFTAGYTKVVWGKADEFHVVDVLNSLDYSDFLQTNYLSMVVSKPMLKADLPLPGGLLLEAVWIPTFEGNTIPMEGSWAPSEMTAAYSAIESAVSYKAVETYSTTYQEQYEDYNKTVYDLAYAGYYAAYTTAGMPAAAAEVAADTAALVAVSSASIKADITANAAASLAQTAYAAANMQGESFYKPMNILDASQFGFHLTGSVAGFDYGAVYYLGYNKNPTLTTTISTESGSPMIVDASISYDPLQVFGLEGAFILAGFNLKAEAAYNMTNDIDGDDPYIHNNSIKWVGGFDRDIPISNFNINIQEEGTYLLHSDKITDNTDIEASSAEIENVITLSLSDSYNHEKIETRITGMYHFEGKDWMLIPEVTFKMDDNLETSLSSRFFFGEGDTLFGQFDANDEVRLTASYSF